MPFMPEVRSCFVEAHYEKDRQVAIGRKPRNNFSKEMEDSSPH
jgi:hypothetical protein